MKKTFYNEEDISKGVVIKSDYATDGPDMAYGENRCHFKGAPADKPFFNLIPVKPGIALMISYFAPQCRIKMDFQTDHSPVQFGYCLKGRCRHKIYGVSKGEKEILTQPGVLNTHYTPDTAGECEMHPGEDQLMVGLQISPRLFMEMLESEMESPSLCRQFSKWNIKTKFTYQSGMTPAMHSVAVQIINCPYRGIVKDLFYESKTIELLSLQIEKLSKNGGNPNQRGKLNRSDIERIHAAERIVVENFKKPPTLAALARQTGLNEFKLKTGFREIFGTTVFGYVRSHKMEKAKRLLETGELNVSETAWQVGYSNVSHFISAYRKQFGVNPGKIL
jgi:AraC-like DNA-binding protein